MPARSYICHLIREAVALTGAVLNRGGWGWKVGTIHPNYTGLYNRGSVRPAEGRFAVKFVRCTQVFVIESNEPGCTLPRARKKEL